jgi:hypothetical protein
VSVPVLLVLFMVEQLLAGGNVQAQPELAQNATIYIKVAVLYFVQTLVSGALGVGTLSYAYKALSGRAPNEIVQPRA